MRNIILFLSVCFGFIGFSQELNCNIVVNALQTGNENLQVFKTLEKQLNEFVNNTTWPTKKHKSQERINCNMVISLTEFSGETFQGTLQVQSSRPVFGSSYSTPLYSFNDKDVTFRYLEFQDLTFNPNQFESNLVSVLAFHIYMILAIDADSFAENGGAPYYTQAQIITNYSQQDNFKGWKAADGLQSRFALIDNILSPTFKEYREVMYAYHINGLDKMSEDVKAGKEEIAAALLKFQAMNRRRPNSFVLRTFFDAKAGEIEQIFSEGPSVNIAKLKEALQKMAPTHSNKWRNIKF